LEISAEAVQMVATSTGKLEIREGPLDFASPVECYLEKSPDAKKAKTLEVDRIYQPGETYYCYNVLWIGWDDGYAYRKGVGRIARDVWRELRLKGLLSFSGRGAYSAGND
jgi:hypothetical protein